MAAGFSNMPDNPTTLSLENRVVKSWSAFETIHEPYQILQLAWLTFLVFHLLESSLKLPTNSPMPAPQTLINSWSP